MGVFLVQFMECFGKGAGKTATIQAILSAMMLCPAPLINSLNVGTRPLVIFGGIVSSIGIFICSFANSVNLLIISYGMVVGKTFYLLPK
uniref:Monocarboxylate transporter 9-like n=1 Tax=Saccoglossus kowalevskii TaxID=10224 RepID=A0ABM0MJU2_SACKO|nr:PREDICTED: monocarboxylate transporter 9-like [Saccoglossus kowalevskii]